MEWSNLRIGMCPSCGSPLMSDGLLSDMMKCVTNQCAFKIGAQKMQSIVSDMAKPKVRRCGTFDNFAELNNLGHKGMSEDFSDSI